MEGDPDGFLRERDGGGDHLRLIARKVHSTTVGLAAGAGFGLLFAYLVALMPEPDGTHYYLQIMVPGFVLGALIGFLTQRMGVAPARA